MSYSGNGSRKVDDLAVNGLLGVVDSLSYMVEEVRDHFHSISEWYGKDPGDAFYLRNGLVPWSVVSQTGPAVWGTEVQLSNGDEVVSGARYDFHQIFITTTDVNDKTFLIEFYHGTSTFVASTLFATIPFRSASTSERSEPVIVQSIPILSTHKVWTRCKCETDNKYVSFLIGLHSYEG